MCSLSVVTSDDWIFLGIVSKFCFFLFRNAFSGPLTEGGQASLPPSPSSNKYSRAHNNKTQHSFTLSKENPKNHVTHPFSSAGISIFSREISNFCYLGKYR